MRLECPGSVGFEAPASGSMLCGACGRSTPHRVDLGTVLLSLVLKSLNKHVLQSV